MTSTSQSSLFRSAPEPGANFDAQTSPIFVKSSSTKANKTLFKIVDSEESGDRFVASEGAIDLTVPRRSSSLSKNKAKAKSGHKIPDTHSLTSLNSSSETVGDVESTGESIELKRAKRRREVFLKLPSSISSF